MGNGNSRVGGCFAPFGNGKEGVELEFLEPLDEGLGHSFCYVRPVIADSPAMTPSNSERFTIDSTIFDSETCSGSFGQDQINLPEDHRAGKIAFPETTFKTISGASVSANASTARTGGNQFNLLAAGDHQAVEPAASFDCTASFTAVPLQPAPHGSGPLDGFMSGPLEKGGGAFMSGPLDGVDRSNFSAPLYYSGRRPTGLRRLVKSAISSRRWVRRLFLHQSAPPMANGGADAGPSTENEYGSAGNLQWAHGKAGEDRVHVVLSEEQGWLFVGIYDGFSGPDAPDFLMAHLYRAIDRELQGLLWDFEDAAEDDLEKIPGDAPRSDPPLTDLEIEDNPGHDGEAGCGKEDAGAEPCSSSSRLSGQGRRSRRLYELLQMELIEEQNAAMASARSGSGRGSDAPPQEKEESAAAAEQSMGEKKLKTKEKKKKKKNLRKKFFPWSYDWHRERQQRQQPQPGDDGQETAAPPGSSSAAVRRCKAGPADPGAVLAALRRALEATEVAFMEMVEKALDRNPELALMGSCVLVMLMKDQDVYAMNLGDSRVVLAQERPGAQRLNLHAGGAAASQSLLRVELDRISEESPMRNPNGHACKINKNSELSLYRLKLRAVQLTTDHSTDVEEEVFRIRGEHADDAQAVFNGRVKGQLKVTRALGAGFLKRADMNEALLEMFRIEYVGAAPYVSCSPSMAHHRLSPGDRFLVLSSDGLYQYFSNEEVVSHVAWFMDNVPDGDPAQYLIAELLFRAAKKNGMDFHALLDIPQGDRRKYHDDVSVMVVSLEGRIWRSSG